MFRLPDLTRLVLHAFHASGFAEKRCGACLMPFAAPHRVALCPACLGELQHGLALCGMCGQEGQLHNGTCGACLAKPPPWSRLHAIGPHEGLLRDLLLRAKYAGDRSAARIVGELMAERLAGSGDLAADVLLPMPLHVSRLRERGFNQCYELAKPISRRLGVPKATGLARRIKPTSPQTGLSRAARQKNISGAFVADRRVLGKRILVLDDTITTGATLRALCTTLHRFGASGVEVCVAAVALAGHNHHE